MGKQAKPKPASQKGTQRNHNPLTRGVNTKKPDLLWDWDLIFDAVEEDVHTEDGVVHRTKLVRKSPEKQKPLWEPLDDLLLEWEMELPHYVLDSSAKMEREPLPTGGSRYTVYIEYGDDAKKIRKNLLVVETPRRTRFANKKRGKKGKNKQEKAATTPAS